jgi:hypothetical protein
MKTNRSRYGSPPFVYELDTIQFCECCERAYRQIITWDEANASLLDSLMRSTTYSELAPISREMEESHFGAETCPYCGSNESATVGINKRVDRAKKKEK